MTSYPKLRLILGYLILLYGIIYTVEAGIQYSWIVFLCGITILLIHFRFGAVWGAFRQLKIGNIEKAEQLIHHIKRPEWLARRARAYFFLVEGISALHSQDLDTGKEALTKALDMGIRSDTDQGLAMINLAQIYFLEKDYEQSDKWLAKGLKLQADLNLLKRMEEMQKTVHQKLN
ncbi:MAG: hypothetical protein AAF598_08555 [Bacteroidota bacterium]